MCIRGRLSSFDPHHPQAFPSQNAPICGVRCNSSATLVSPQVARRLAAADHEDSEEHGRGPARPAVVERWSNFAAPLFVMCTHDGQQSNTPGRHKNDFTARGCARHVSVNAARPRWPRTAQPAGGGDGEVASLFAKLTRELSEDGGAPEAQMAQHEP